MAAVVPLYVQAPALAGESGAAQLLREIRASSYIAEVVSGEGPLEDSPLWDMIRPVPASLSPPMGGGAKAAAVHDADVLSKHEGTPPWTRNVLVVADDETVGAHGSLLVVQLDKLGAPVDELRVVPRSLLEVCANLVMGTESLAQFKSLCKGQVYDAGQ
ncbi:hypothetical protein MSPP1_002161 [Malassezia sp. CBS 17886]|nr:hypothetical protein MSPP1_002161 [Malassezia sp. CBS 17886]